MKLKRAKSKVNLNSNSNKESALERVKAKLLAFETLKASKSYSNYKDKAIDDLYGPYLDLEEQLKGNIVFKYRNGASYNSKTND